MARLLSLKGRGEKPQRSIVPKVSNYKRMGFPRHGLYIRIWRECLNNGFTTEDARQYAQMEIDKLDREERLANGQTEQPILLPLTVKDFSEPKMPKPPTLPATVIDVEVEKEEPKTIAGMAIPDFIKPNSRACDRIKHYYGRFDEEDWHGYY